LIDKGHESFEGFAKKGFLSPEFAQEVWMKRYLAIGLLIALFPFFSGAQPAPEKLDTGAMILFSANVYGEVEPCG